MIETLRTLAGSAGHSDLWQWQKRDIGIDLLDKWIEGGFGTSTYTGKAVSVNTALGVRAVWACVRALSDDIATLPLVTYRRTSAGRERATDHYLYTLLLKQANPEMTAFRFKRQMQMWISTSGNAFAEIEISGRGQVVALWPWRPDRVQVSRETEGGPLAYTYRMNDGRKFTLPASRILHLRGLEADGVMGLDPIQTHKQSVGMALAIQEHGARFFSNGARPLGVLEHPAALGDEGTKNIRDAWQKMQGGLENAHRIAILEEGMKYHEVGMKMVDAQYIENMNLGVEDIASIYGVPPHRIGHLARSTNNNIEHQGREYKQYSLGPLSENWEQELMHSLLSAREQQTIELEFLFSDLLRGDMKAQAEFYTALGNLQALTPDEIREDIGRNKLPDGMGEKPLRPFNMAPADQPLNQPTVKAPAPKKAAPVKK